MYPYNYVTRTQAKKLAEKVESGSCVSSLMFGVQWDLILKFIEEKTVLVASEENKTTIRTDIIKKLNSDSTIIGNYNNNHWNITNRNTKYSINNGQIYISGVKEKTLDANILLSTGASEEFKLLNIYDIAGNVWEWTLEKSFESSNPCVRRGGGFDYEGSGCTSSHRSGDITSLSYYDIGFRISIIK